MNFIGTRLKELRQTLGFKQAEMPDKLGVGNQKTWSNYETGVSFIPQAALEQLFIRFGIDLHWLLTGEGTMFRTERAENGEYLFEVPLLSKEEVYSLQKIEEPTAHTGKYPDIVLVPVSDRLKEFSTDLRAMRVFNSRMSPVLNAGDIALFEATGWNGDGIYIYKMLESLHLSRLRFTSDVYEISHEFAVKEPPVYDEKTFFAIGRIRAVIKEV